MEISRNKTKYIIGMVGLPARGKTYIARKMKRYLSWLGYNVRVFNIGNYRRVMVGAQDLSVDFFDPKNADGVKKRDECAVAALKDLMDYLSNTGEIAIYDGTNTTKQRRLLVKNTLEESMKNYTLIWLESICDNQDIIDHNIISAKVNNPDYVGKAPSEVVQDFKIRIQKYEEQYEMIEKVEYEKISFVKLINFANEIVINNVEGLIPTKIISYITNLHPYERPIYLIRNGETKNEVKGKIGGDSELTEKGFKLANLLNSFVMRENIENEIQSRYDNQVKYYSSTNMAAEQTVEIIEDAKKVVFLKILDSIDVGTFNEMTFEEIKEKHFDEYQSLLKDKLRKRYPRGESYLDLCQRIEQLIFDIECFLGPVFVFADVSILRCLYGYFTKFDIGDIPTIDIPLNTAIKLIPETYFCKEKRFTFNINSGEVSEEYIQNAIMIPVEQQNYKNY